MWSNLSGVGREQSSLCDDFESHPVAGEPVLNEKNEWIIEIGKAKYGRSLMQPRKQDCKEERRNSR